MARRPAGKARKRITIRDVAARAGVDASLVSRVLNDHPKASAGPATRERIQEAARSLGVAIDDLVRTTMDYTFATFFPEP